MLNQPTIEKLHTMKLYGMADAFRAQLETTESHELGFEERFALLVDHQWLWKENRALGRRLRSAKLKERSAIIEDVDYRVRHVQCCDTTSLPVSRGSSNTTDRMTSKEFKSAARLLLIIFLAFVESAVIVEILMHL